MFQHLAGMAQTEIIATLVAMVAMDSLAPILVFKDQLDAATLMEQGTGRVVVLAAKDILAVPEVILEIMVTWVGLESKVVRYHLLHQVLVVQET
jgi:putative effector of murein hydrolase